MTLRVLKLIAAGLFWSAAAAAAMTALGMALAFGVLAALWVFGPLAVIVLLPMSARMGAGLRRRRALIVLTYLEQAVRLNLPLPRVLLAAEQSEGGKVGQRLSDLRDLLESGASVERALEEGVPEMPERVIRMAGAGERMGRLPQALSHLVIDGNRVTRREASSQTIALPYALVMVTVVGGIVAMLLVFVMPKFMSIFQDFGMSVPPVTQGLLWVAAMIGPAVGVAVMVTVLLYSGSKLWETFHAGRSGFEGAGLWAAGVTPVVRGVARARSLADVCQIVGDALQVGRSADAALDEAAELELVPWVRVRVRRWAEGIVQGMTLQESARRAGMPELVAGMLGAAGAGDAGTALHFLARYYRDKFSRLVLLARAAAMPAMVLAFAVIVALVALSMFVPIVSMIDNLMPLPRAI